MSLTRFKSSLIAALVGAFLLILAFPATAFATPAITNLTMDRTTVTPGQSITFSVRTTPQAQFVFAMIDGIRAQGTRISTDATGNHNWQITINPTRSATVVVFANATNTETGAASMSVPITVTGTTAADPVLPIIPVTPGNVGNIGPVGITNLRETPAIAPNAVRLTLNTGPEANYTWVRFDGSRYVQGTMIAQNALYRTWTIDFRPQTWAVQQVQVGANRTYHYTGAALQNFNLTLTQPFVPPIFPEIRNAVLTPTQVNAGARQTIRITTNEHVGAVWIRDMDGRETNARSITPNTATTRTWEVNFNPTRSGTVTIYANATRTATGAATRQESITVRGQNVNINDARITRTSGATNDGIIRVTTNRYAESVWVLHNNNIFPLHHISGTTGNRVWEVHITNASLPLQVRASANRNHTGVDDELTIWNWNVTHWGDGRQDDNWWWDDPWHNWNWGTGTTWGTGPVREISIPSWSREISRSASAPNREVRIRVETRGHVNYVGLAGSNFTRIDSRLISGPSIHAGNEHSDRVWEITIRIDTSHPLTWTDFGVEAWYGNNIVGHGRTPEIRIVS